MNALYRDADFRQIYISLGLLDSAGSPQPLHESCQNAPACWSQLKMRPPEDSASLARPYVGEKYEQLRLLVIGENMNGDGGYGEINELFRLARPEVEQGSRRIRFGCDWKKYRGTTTWHRLGYYGLAFAEEQGLEQRDWPKGEYPKAEDVLRGYDYIAFCNHVKCSPDPTERTRSIPTESMWERCGAHVLANEFFILQPRDVLVLGHDNHAVLLKYVLNNGIQNRRINGDAIVVTIGDNPYGIRRVIGIPHPALGPGARIKAIDDLRQALSER